MKIIADSSCLFSPEEGKQQGVTIVPVGVIIDGKAYKDYEEIQSAELLTLLNQGVVPTTSQPTVGDVIQAYEETEDEEILVLPIGDGLSGAYQNAHTAKNALETTKSIEIMDTKTLAGAHHYIVQKAIQLKEKGLSLENIKKELQESIEHSFSYVIPFDFQFLKRCGRLTPIAANLGGLMKIVPVLTLTEDRRKIEIHTVKRTVKKAIDNVIQTLKEKGVNEEYMISVCHVGVQEKANEILQQLKDTFHNATYELLELSPSLMLHGGPGCILVHATKK